MNTSYAKAIANAAADASNFDGRSGSLSLETCPLYQKPMRKVISQANTPRIVKRLSVCDAKKAGFTVLKRVSKGEYERQ